MKAAETLIVWSQDLHDQRIGVGPLMRARASWTWAVYDYPFSGGAAWTARRRLRGFQQRFHVMLDWYQLVYMYGLHRYLVHRAFLHIDEYQETIKEYGMGPDKGELGHDPNIYYDRAVADDPLPEIEEEFHLGAYHLRLIGAADSVAHSLHRADHYAEGD